MLRSIYHALIALTTLVVGLPAINSFDNVPANETQLSPPYTYVLPTDYTPKPQ
jgi:hypothetical protein